jgi:hypothetical protein
MQKTLKELAILANPNSKQIYDVVESWPYNCAAWSGDDLNKFKDLLVEECINVLKNEVTMKHCAYTTFDSGVVECVIDEAEKAIRNHFKEEI